jgi:hypothetical protein
MTLGEKIRLLSIFQLRINKYRHLPFLNIETRFQNDSAHCIVALFHAALSVMTHCNIVRLIYVPSKPRLETLVFVLDV